MWVDGKAFNQMEAKEKRQISGRRYLKTVCNR
jgi:hypothetical protein